MPIVVPAIVAVATAASAVGTAVTTGVVAGLGTALATAAVNLGTLIGVVGLGMSVVGMATGNQTLSKIGGYLGMAGGVMGLAGAAGGGLAGAMKNFSSWSDDLGNMFSSTKAVGQAPLGSVGNATAQNATASVQQVAAVKPTSIPTASGTLGPRPQMLPPPSASTGASTAGVNPLDFAGTAKAGAGPNMAATQFANAGPVSAPSATSQLAAVTSQANAAPVVGQSFPASVGVSNVPGMTGAGASAASAGGSSLGSMFSSLPDWAKAQMAITGAQGVSGLLGGWFESATAEEKLALEREAQQWKMQHEDSIKNFNQKNASYAPLVTFGGGGMLSRGKA